mmetsp:Transcript_43792/g.98998  ORF Transcript_43792/g.98998 Transcript_43792/m.98998 type:complete len:516 (+) Transcript_43792:131-1678(+)|eukprot:CAMPEP_0172617390 /NCGR_PEP_ID=MMETSP1068-20121228/70223_1 /TAXON_ID=35684 /ORGANISM="Pseudopedinella elastica, Strain CCMP716" /LENGTH=515 /DNA_ID=CAMNT_0013423143 /DNA_START=53 /DNA_END=1600 /DNA_ORIENTATION=-
MGRGSGASTAQGQEAKATNGKQNYEYAEIVTKEPHITWFAAFTTYLGYAVLILLGRVRDLVGRFFGDLAAPTPPPSGMAPLIFASENFYTRRLYYRVQEAFNRPIQGPPGATINVVRRERKGASDCLMHVKEPREVTPCLNLGSYNYLGFADDWKNTCGPDVLGALEAWPVGVCAGRLDGGSTLLHKELERLVADFLGKEDAIVYNMGFATNSNTIPALVGKGDLIISDALNHTSIVNGARSSEALIRIFKHNDAADLEQVLRDSISMGQPRTRRPWNKIVVAVEGIYSMEGEVCNLAAIVQVCKKYRVYLYLDEAHSIGALGPSGRGVTEHCGVATSDVDVMMGTFTKSFGGMGGYIAADKAVIDHLRVACAGSVHHTAMSPVVCQQVLTAFKIIMGVQGGELGEAKLSALKDNANYFRSECIKMGLHVYGDYDSPIIPVLLYNPTKILEFSRECFTQNLAVVVVGFPATPVVLSRCRFCISAGHTRAQLEDALVKIKKVATDLKLRYANSVFG